MVYLTERNDRNVQKLVPEILNQIVVLDDEGEAFEERIAPAIRRIIHLFMLYCHFCLVGKWKRCIFAAMFVYQTLV